MSASYYDGAEICTNGHVITPRLRLSPTLASKYCATCGGETLRMCQHCRTEIRDEYVVPGVAAIGFEFVPPSFCHACGRPYAWTAARVEAACELAMELDGLDQDEREQLAKTLDDIVRDGPRTTLAATRFKRLAAKAGRGAAESFREILVDVLSETAKKMIFGK